MSAKRMALRWLLRVGIATAILAGIGILGDPGNAMAANLAPGQGSATVTDGHSPLRGDLVRR